MRPAILPPTIVTKMVFLMMKVFKCLWVMEDVEIGLLRKSTLPLSIVEFIIVVTMVEVNIGLKRPDTIYLAILEFIILVLMLEVELGLKITATLLNVMVEQELMLTGDVDIYLRPDILPPITQVDAVYF